MTRPFENSAFSIRYPIGTNDGTMGHMATNLRLRPATETALRDEAARTGRSQQDIIREALDRFLGLAAQTPLRRPMEDLIAAGIVRPPVESFRRANRLLKLPEGVTSMDLLDREDRF